MVLLCHPHTLVDRCKEYNFLLPLHELRFLAVLVKFVIFVHSGLCHESVNMQERLAGNLNFHIKQLICNIFHLVTENFPDN